MSKLAILGGEPTIKDTHEEMFKWPIITEEDEQAALQVMRDNSYSATDITIKFQDEFAAWQGRDYALAFCNGTMAIEAAMFAIGLGRGDEIICPTKTYWASIAAALGFGAVPVFCNIDENLSLDPSDLERCITPRTKAVVVVHYFGYPCDMDRIMAIAKKHGIIVLEDVSHAQGGLYKGKKLGTFGEIAAMSLMSGKSFAAGELGIMVTDDKRMLDRAIAYAHYERNNPEYITTEELKPYSGISLGGRKGRANQLCSALARIQLKYYDERCAEIRRAMNYFWDLLEGTPGIHAIRVDESEGSNMAGWYAPHGRYVSSELGGLSVKRFCEAVRAEGFGKCWDGGNYCLHTHKLFSTCDLYNGGKPTRVEFSESDVVATDELCAASVGIDCFQVPWFKHFDKELIEKYAEAFKKVAANYAELLENDAKDTQGGRWFGADNA